MGNPKLRNYAVISASSSSVTVIQSGPTTLYAIIPGMDANTYWPNNARVSVYNNSASAAGQTVVSKRFDSNDFFCEIDLPQGLVVDVGGITGGLITIVYS